MDLKEFAKMAVSDKKKPSYSRGAAIGAAVGALPGLRESYRKATIKKLKHSRPWLHPKGAPAVALTGAALGALLGLGVQALRRNKAKKP